MSESADCKMQTEELFCACDGHFAEVESRRRRISIFGGSRIHLPPNSPCGERIRGQSAVRGAVLCPRQFGFVQENRTENS